MPRAAPAIDHTAGGGNRRIELSEERGAPRAIEYRCPVVRWRVTGERALGVERLHDRGPGFPIAVVDDIEDAADAAEREAATSASCAVLDLAEAAWAGARFRYRLRGWLRHGLHWGS